MRTLRANFLMRTLRANFLMRSLLILFTRLLLMRTLFVVIYKITFNPDFTRFRGLSYEVSLKHSTFNADFTQKKKIVHEVSLKHSTF